MDENTDIHLVKERTSHWHGSIFFELQLCFVNGRFGWRYTIMLINGKSNGNMFVTGKLLKGHLIYSITTITHYERLNGLLLGKWKKTTITVLFYATYFQLRLTMANEVCR